MMIFVVNILVYFTEYFMYNDQTNNRCKQLFLTKKHDEENEILTRVTNDARRKKELQEYEKQARAQVTLNRKNNKKNEDEARKRQVKFIVYNLFLVISIVIDSSSFLLYL